MVLKTEERPVRTEADVVGVRQLARAWATELRLSLVDQTKVVTAASELARNTLTHGGGGTVRLELLDEGGRHGLRLTFEDKGPGIPDVTRAMQDGYSTAGGLGLGLSGSRRLMHDFDLQSTPGEGTRVTVTRWK